MPVWVRQTTHNTEPRRWTFAADDPGLSGARVQVMSKSNLNYGTFPLATGRTSEGYKWEYVAGNTLEGCYFPEPIRLEVRTRYYHPAFKSAEDSAAVFKRAIRLTPNQLLADPTFRTLATAAIGAGKRYTADLLKWEDKATVTAAVAQLRESLERKAARRVATGVDPLSTATARRVERLRRFREWHAKRQSAPSVRSMSGTSTGVYRCGPCLVTVAQTEHCDWDRYSKGWHAKYGPAKTVSTTVTVERWDGVTAEPVRQTYFPGKLQHIDRRATEYVAEFLGLPKQRGKIGLRIDARVTLTAEVSPNKHTQVYRRELAGEVLGFVAVRRGTHYHDSSVNSAVAGVLRKLATDRLHQQQRAAGQAIGLDMTKPIGAVLRSYGFCAAGVADALDMLGLADAKYAPADLIAAGKWDRLPAVAKKYPREVATIRDVVASLPDLPANVAALVG